MHIQDEEHDPLTETMDERERRHVLYLDDHERRRRNPPPTKGAEPPFRERKGW